MRANFNSSSKPKLACEIAADRVVAGRVSERGHMVDACTAGELARGSVVPDLLEANLRERQDVFDTVSETLGALNSRSRDVIAVLPDAAVRVMLLDFETLPANRTEAESVVRFRLKKSLPFDLDKAKISYHAQQSANGLKVVAAVALSSVIEDYESVFREAGYSPGIVLPSMLAALGAAEATRPTLVVKVDSRTTSIAILDKNQLLLFRTLENPRGVTITGEQLAEEVYPSVVFFQDTYQSEYRTDFRGWPRRLRRSSSRSACPDRSRGHGTGFQFTVGRERRIDSEVENGRGCGGPFVVNAR